MKIKAKFIGKLDRGTGFKNAREYDLILKFSWNNFCQISTPSGCVFTYRSESSFLSDWQIVGYYMEFLDGDGEVTLFKDAAEASSLLVKGGEA